MPPLTRKVVGALTLCCGIALSALAATTWWRERSSTASPMVDGPDGAVPDLAASVIVRSETEGTLRPPTPLELTRAREAIAAELAAMAPGPVERIATTSGVGYVLGMHGASAAIYWPNAEGAPALQCRDVPLGDASWSGQGER